MRLSSKRVLSGLLTAAMVLSLSVSAFAAGSPTTGDEPTTVTEPNVTAKKSSKVDTNENGTAVLKKYYKVSGKTIKLTAKVTVKGQKYRLVEIAKNAFKNNTQVTTISVAKNVTKIDKNAFAGLTKLKKVNLLGTKAVTIQKGAFGKLKTKKITIYTKLTGTKLKNFKKMLAKIGFEGKVAKLKA